MSTFTKKIAVSLVTATTVVSLSGFGALALPVASAATNEELQAQISQLLQMIASLQAQLANQGGSTGGTVTTACSFSRSLTLGSDGSDVMCLQQYLNGAGFTLASSGAGSPGNETTYFGPRTRSAVAAWQAANGVSPAVGYFGPISQAKYTSLVGTTTGGNTGGTTPPVVTPGATLQVGLSANSAKGAAISGAGQVSVATFNLTAPATTGVTLTGLTLTKVGVMSDSNVSNLYLANATTGAIEGQFSSLNNGVAQFDNLSVNIPAGTTYQAEIRMDLSTSATAGNTIAWSLTGLTATGATVTGLPVVGNTLTVTSVSNPSISTVTLTANAVGSTVDAGTTSVQVSSWTANVSNSKVRLNNMQFTFVGSAAASDVRNLRLMVNGTEVATLPSASTETVFNIPGGVELNTGNSTIQIFADVMGSPNRTFTFSLLQPYKVNVVDTQYNTGISPTITSTNQTTITINTGSITVQTASDSPSNPIPAGASAVTLAKFNIYAAGEPVKVKFLDAVITETGSSAWSTIGNVTDDVSNVRLLDDAGNQVGNTISTVASGTSSGQCDLASTTITCHFGTSGSPINYVVPANTTRTLSLQADIGASTDATTLAGSLPGNSSNLEGQTSYQSASSGVATGATRSVSSSPLTVALNTGFSVPTYIAGAQNVRIASFVITAGSSQGANISSLTFDKDSDATMDLQNLKVMVNGSQFGATKATISDAETSMAFSASSPVAVSAGGSVTVDVYADILTTSTATTKTATIDQIGWTALGASSNSSITHPGAVSGQNVTVSSGPTLTLATSSNTPAAKQIVMGSTGVELGTWRFSSNNVDDIRITDIAASSTISGTTSATSASLTNLTLWDGSTKVAGPINMVLASAASGTLTFSLSTPVVVPKNGNKELTLKGDVATFNAGATSGQVHTLSIDADNLTAKSVGSPTATVTLSGDKKAVNAVTVYRTKISLSSSVIGATTGRARKANDNLATLSLTADSADNLTLSSIVVKFTGKALSGISGFTVDLIDANTNAALTGTSSATCTQVGNSCTATFTPTGVISAGTTKNVEVRADSSSFADNSNTSDSLSVFINAVGDIKFSDGTTSDISLEATVVPFDLANVSYE